MNWTNGFAAGTYQRGGEVVVAFRGTETDDSRDLFADAMMVPLTRPGDGERTLNTLFRQYNIAEPGAIANVAPALLDSLMQTNVARNGIRAAANRVPVEQLHGALSYFDRMTIAPTAVTGHSLGGALAQLVSMHRNVPCVAFNSPHMGDLAGGRLTLSHAVQTVPGTVPMTSMIIVQVNANLDPLSMATNAVGNLTHGRVITVDLPRYHTPPTRATLSIPWWVNVVAPIPAMAARLGHAVGAEARYSSELLSYLGEIMLYGHSMDNLRQAIDRIARFARPLPADMRQI